MLLNLNLSVFNLLSNATIQKLLFDLSKCFGFLGDTVYIASLGKEE